MTTLSIPMPGSRRLWLVGDDEALDVLAELSQHFDYFSVARLDELPSEPLSTMDHLVVGSADAVRGAQLLADALVGGKPGFARLLASAEPTSGDDVALRPGARAILMAASLLMLGRESGTQ